MPASTTSCSDSGASFGIRLGLALTVGGIRTLTKVFRRLIRVDRLVHRSIRSGIADGGVRVADLGWFLIGTFGLSLGHVRVALAGHRSVPCSGRMVVPQAQV